LRRLARMKEVQTWLERIDAVEGRLQHSIGPLEGLTAPDPNSGEQWDASQVWGHLAEFVEYWIGIFGELIDEFAGESIPFGRASDDESRMAGLRHGSRLGFDRLWGEVRHDLDDLRHFLQTLPASAEHVVGIPPDGGERSLVDLIDAYLVDHLEEHAAQLESIRTFHPTTA